MGLTVYGISSNGNGWGFFYCINLINCKGIGSGTGTSKNGYGFQLCNSLINCIGNGSSANNVGIGIDSCSDLVNCEASGIGNTGYSYYNITRASNCRNGNNESTTKMWMGPYTYNIDINTCKKTLTYTDINVLNS